MEDSNILNRLEFSQEILSIINEAKEQSKLAKSQRLTFNSPKTTRIDEKSLSLVNPPKSSDSVVDLTKNSFNYQSDSNLDDSELKLQKFNDHKKTQKKKIKKKIKKISCRLKNQKIRYNRPPIKIPELVESDRPILINHFKEIIENYFNQKRKNKLLQRKVITYLTINKIKKALIDDSENEDKEEEKVTYYKNLEKIHGLKQELQLMKEEFELEKMVKMKKRDELIEMKNVCVQDFHTTVYSKALELESKNPIPEKFIKRQLNKFHRSYNEVTNLRKENFKLQQAITEYLENEKKIEEIDDGLTLFEYENIKTRLQIITSNIDAKNKILEKMRMKIGKDAEDDEKYTTNLKILETKLAEAAEILHQLKADQAKLSNESKKLKSLEKQLETKINDIYIKGQMLFERSLMIDYDKMDEKLCTRKVEAAKIEDENQKLDQKLRKYEEELKSLEAKKGKAEKNVEALSLYEERVTLFRKMSTS